MSLSGKAIVTALITMGAIVFAQPYLTGAEQAIGKQNVLLVSILVLIAILLRLIEKGVMRLEFDVLPPNEQTGLFSLDIDSAIALPRLVVRALFRAIYGCAFAGIFMILMTAIMENDPTWEGDTQHVESADQ